MSLTQKLRWRGTMTYEIDGFPPVVFVGRNPTRIDDEMHINLMMGLGVFDVVGKNSLRYKSPAYIVGKSGKRYDIDDNGEIRLDISDTNGPRADIESQFEDAE